VNDLSQYLKVANRQLDEYRQRQVDEHTSRLDKNDIKSVAPANFQAPYSIRDFSGRIYPSRLVASAGVGIRLAKVGTSSGAACEISFGGLDNWFALLPGSEIRVPFNSFYIRCVSDGDSPGLGDELRYRLVIYHREDVTFFEPDSNEARTQTDITQDTAIKSWTSSQLYNSALNKPTDQVPADYRAGLNLDGISSLRIMAETNGVMNGGSFVLWYYDPVRSDWFENQSVNLIQGTPVGNLILWNDLPVTFPRGAVYVEARSVTSGGGSGAITVTMNGWAGT
jgi:hypothetical protein